MDDLPQSKLAVLLHADVVGSTAMVQADQARAHIGMREAFRQLSDSVEAHSGTTREIRGDALVAEFYRASDAVTAASGFQKDWTESSPEGGDVQIRIGIAMGEVIIADQTVTGEGVIMAQRIEQLAEPGSICLQGAVYETLPGWKEDVSGIRNYDELPANLKRYVEYVETVCGAPVAWVSLGPERDAVIERAVD